MVKKSKQQVSNTNSKQKKKGIRGWQIGVIILFAIIVVGGIIYLLYGSLPTSLISAFLYNRSPSGESLKSVLLQRIDSMPMLATSYSGKLDLNGQDPNIKITFIKYYNQTRLTYYLENISFIGSGDITVINSTNNTAQNEICVPTSLALFSSSQLSTKTTYYCANSDSTNYTSLVDQLDGVLSVDNIRNLGVSFAGLGFYNWQLCYKISGYGNLYFNRQLIKENGTVNSTLNFNSCVSAQYGIPITLSGTIRFNDTSGSLDTLGFNLTQINMNRSTTAGEVLQLPISN